MGICLINFNLFRPIPLFLFYIYHFDLDDLPSNCNTKFNVVIADLRAKDSSDIIRKLSLLIEDSGILILGSIDDIDEEATTEIQSGSELRKKFERIPLRDNEALFPHIYQETVNKHQYAMSFLSACFAPTLIPELSGTHRTSTCPGLYVVFDSKHHSPKIPVVPVVKLLS